MSKKPLLKSHLTKSVKIKYKIVKTILKKTLIMTLVIITCKKKLYLSKCHKLKLSKLGRKLSKLGIKLSKLFF